MITLDRKLFLNRRLKTRLDLIRSDLGGKVFFDEQSDEKFRIDKGSKEGEFTIGEQVLVQNFEENQIDSMVPLQNKPRLCLP